MHQERSKKSPKPSQRSSCFDSACRSLVPAHLNGIDRCDGSRRATERFRMWLGRYRLFSDLPKTPAHKTRSLQPTAVRPGCHAKMQANPTFQPTRPPLSTSTATLLTKFSLACFHGSERDAVRPLRRLEMAWSPGELRPDCKHQRELIGACPFAGSDCLLRLPQANLSRGSTKQVGRNDRVEPHVGESL